MKLAFKRFTKHCLLMLVIPFAVNVHSTSVSSPKRALRREAPCQGIPLVCKSWHTPWRMNPSSVSSDHALTAGDVRGASVRTIASPAPGSRRRAGTQGSGLHTAQCVRLGTRCATIADGSPGRHRRPPSEASSAATEHSDDDNTGPRGSDATERAATIEVMTTPACDAATDGRRLGAATEHAKLVVTERAHAQAYCRS